MLQQNDISVISPVYGNTEVVPDLCHQLHQSISKLTKHYEIILVFDCSPDNGWTQICEECKKDPRVKGIKLSRNFGQHYAITAGLEHCSGEWVVVMDADLQDNPQEIPDLYNEAQNGYDIVLAQRVDRQDHWWKKLSSLLFYKVFGFLTDTEQDASVANFGVYHRDVIQAVLSMGDNVRYFPTMIQWVGFRATKKPVHHRAFGKSTYSVRKLFSLAFDNIIAFSDKPLRLTVQLGFLIVLLTILVAAYFLLQYLLGDITVSGYASLILSIWFLSGVIIFTLGIVGIYIGKSFDIAKQRPKFVVQNTVNFDED